MKLTLEKDRIMSLALALFATYAVMLLPADASAAFLDAIVETDDGPSALINVLCNVVNWFTGGIGAGIATLAIIVVGIGALMGKVSWGMAIIVGLGVGVIFGASTVVDALGGESACSA